LCGGSTQLSTHPSIHSFFHPIFRNKTAPLGLEFPMELLPLEGESLGLPDESFDQVSRLLLSVGPS